MYEPIELTCGHLSGSGDALDGQSAAVAPPPHRPRTAIAAAVILAIGLGHGVANAYTNPAKAVIGSTPATVLERAPGIIASNLYHWSGPQLATLSNTDLVGLYVAAPNVMSYISAASPATYARLSYSVRAAYGGGTLVNIGGHAHYVKRESSITQQQLDAANAIYLDMLSRSPNLPYPTREKEAVMETIAVIATSVAAGGVLDVLGAAGTGWWLGHEVIGPVANWLMETYTPNLYAAIGNGIGTIVFDLTQQEAVGEAGIYQLAEFEFQLQMQFSVPYVNAYGSMDAEAGCLGVSNSVPCHP